MTILFIVALPSQISKYRVADEFCYIKKLKKFFSVYGIYFF